MHNIILECGAKVDNTVYPQLIVWSVLK